MCSNFGQCVNSGSTHFNFTPEIILTLRLPIRFDHHIKRKNF